MGIKENPEEKKMQAELNVQVGERMRSWRIRNGYTQEQVAEKLGISDTFYGRIERGENGMSTLRLVMAYQKMGINPTYLLTGVTDSDINLELFLDKCPEEKKKSLKELINQILELFKKLYEQL